MGRYVVLEPIGHGGMGVVLAAFDPELGRKVAIKLLHATAGRGSLGRSRMLREAQALARLSHENVVAVHDVGVADGRVFIAMEFVAGVTLSAWLTNNERSWPEIIKVFVDAGRGLAAAHAAGLVHRDFKPHNVLIGDDGRARVTDFGLARSRPGRDSSGGDSLHESMERSVGEIATGELSVETELTLTRTGDHVGTPAYMAPEQFDGGEVDPNADQFSFCVALYEALYGERPFAGRTAAEIMRQIHRGRVRAAAAGRTVPPWLRRAVLRGLRSQPNLRWPSMNELLNVLSADRFRRARKGAMVVGPPVLLGALFIASAVDDDSCDGAADKLVGVWDAQRKAEIERRFNRTGMPYAPAAWTSVQGRLDGLAADWVSAQQAACEAGRSNVPVGLGRTMACLHRRFEELRSYSELLSEADAMLVEHAVSTVEALGTVQDCARAHAGSDGVPAEAQREIAEALAHARVMGEAGRYEAAVEAASTARKRAEQVDDRWLAAEATFELARVQEAAGQLQDSKRSYHDAFSAGVAARHDEVVLRAAMSVGVMIGDDDKDFQSADNWLEHAAGALERLGDAGIAFRGQLANVRGRVAHARGDYQQARESFSEGLRLRREVLGPDSPQLASYHVNLGHALANLGELKLAADSMRRALELEQREYGREHPRVATTLAALCSVLRESDDTDDAIAACRGGVAVLRATLGDNHPRTGTAITNLGAALAGAGRHDEALEAFVQSLAIAKSVWGEQHPRTGLVLNNLAVHHEQQHDYVQAETYARQSLSAFESGLGKDHPTTAVVAANLANLLTKQERYADAEVILRGNVEVLERRLGPQHPDLAGAVGMLAETFIHRERFAEAVPLLRRSVAILEQATGRGADLGSARFALGATLYDMGEDRKAARALVRLAGETFAKLGTRPDRVEEIETWLAQHPLVGEQGEPVVDLQPSG